MSLVDLSVGKFLCVVLEDDYDLAARLDTSLDDPLHQHVISVEMKKMREYLRFLSDKSKVAREEPAAQANDADDGILRLT